MNASVQACSDDEVSVPLWQLLSMEQRGQNRAVMIL